MQQGAETIHAVNPNVLVILSGLDYDKDLSFLQKRPVNVSFTRKIVFELHWYSFSHSGAWRGNVNDACGWISGSIMGKAGFLADEGHGPLFVSEFGANGRGDDVNDNRYINCFMALAAEQDWDFAVWTLQGSYYFREGVVGMDEYYGLLDYNWNNVRNSTLLKRLSSLQMPFRGNVHNIVTISWLIASLYGSRVLFLINRYYVKSLYVSTGYEWADPGAKQSLSHGILSKILFHPLTGLCVMKGNHAGRLRLGPCRHAKAWIYTPQETLQVRSTKYFLQAIGAQKPVELIKSSPASQWNQTSNSKLHLSAKATDGITVCLDVDDGGNLVTNMCKCLQGDGSCDPSSQWFKLVDSTRV